MAAVCRLCGLADGGLPGSKEHDEENISIYSELTLSAFKVNTFFLTMTNTFQWGRVGYW